jgi:hypothetical protein
MERQIAAAAAYLRMNMAGPSLEIQGTPAPSSRTVGSFAMEMLVMLCDGPVKAAQRDERIEECLARMKERCLPQRRGGPDR